MTITPTQVQKLLTGEYKFSQLAFSMLVTRWKKDYAKDASQEAAQKCADELNGFFHKYSTVMVSSDLDIVSGL